MEAGRVGLAAARRIAASVGDAQEAAPQEPADVVDLGQESALAGPFVPAGPRFACILAL
jgi:hypothetical protein